MESFESRLEKEKSPSLLKTLTLLTFIGSSLGVIGQIYNYFSAQANIDKLEKLRARPDFDQMPAFVKATCDESAMNNLRLIEANKIPLLILGIIGPILCFYGAWEMRQLKKSGLIAYITGSLLPMAGMLIFVGTSIFSGMSYLIALGVTILFLILYVSQAKHLR